MACLNIPLEIRYKPENLYLAGIIPGPVEPHGDRTNHYIRPLIEDLAVSWHRGVKYSRTALYPTGRSTRSAIAACVCDLVAARKTAALANHGARFFCSVCKCYHEKKYSPKEKGRVDIENWVLHDDQVRRCKAEEYRKAKTSRARDEIFTQHGLRWSALWILPYWKPGIQLVVDPMHCILEGAVQFHIRQVLHLDWVTAEHKEKEAAAFYCEFSPIPSNDEGDWTDNEKNSLSDIHRWLCAPLRNFEEATLGNLQKRLAKGHVRALVHVVTDLVPDEPGAKPQKRERKDYADILVEWRKQFPLRNDAPTSKFATPALLEFIRRVIHETATPSWVSTVPQHFGAKTTGTLKASEWRTLAEIYLPIALVLFWSDQTRYPTPELQRHFKDVLDHTMALFIAIRLACLRTTNPARITAYEENMQQYVRDLQTLHPMAGLRTNLHMALHIPEFLRQFGPVHSWWTFPFERLIGILQRLPTNGTTGQEEATMLHTYLQAASLRRWVAQRDCPVAIQEIKSLFDRIYGTPTDINNDGKISSNEESPEHTSSHDRIPPHLNGLVPAGSKLRAHFRHQGINYSRASTHLGNSLIEYHLDEGGAIVPGSIQHIYTDKNNHTVFLVRQQELAPAHTPNPFSPYSRFPAKIYSTSLSPSLKRVEPKHIFCHYARFDIDENHCVILSLHKVQCMTHTARLLGNHSPMSAL
ncbi:hypothetical protein BDN72DRAFT_869515 [Pluteus cervinus]|uniref:Uncharacterized protein n=1 Tax=Pluteus cervinus TaxID=181527 RepID=A0ACD3B3F7_9AGAR|nr:hypothetical protein BDN72DRAFT_869515 [Pluteus cervinus]